MGQSFPTQQYKDHLNNFEEDKVNYQSINFDNDEDSVSAKMLK